MTYERKKNKIKLYFVEQSFYRVEGISIQLGYIGFNSDLHYARCSNYKTFVLKLLFSL